MKNKKINKTLLITVSAALVAPIVVDLTVNSVEVEASEIVKLSEKKQGDIIILGGREYRVVSQKYGGTLVQEVTFLNNIMFDGDFGQNIFNPNDSNNIGYYLNNTYYNSLSEDAKKAIKKVDWHIGNEKNESAITTNANIGLLTKSDWESAGDYYGGKIPTAQENTEWLLTHDSTDSSFVWVSVYGQGFVSSNIHAFRSILARPALVLDSNFYVNSSGQVVETVNQAPTNKTTIPSQIINGKGKTTSIDLVNYFQDADGDVLTYTATSNATNKVSTSISGSNLTLTGVDTGLTTVVVKATDPSGASSSQKFNIEVMASTPVGPSEPIVDLGNTGGGSNGEINLGDFFEDENPGDLIFTPNIIVNEPNADIYIKNQILVIENAEKDGLISVEVEAKNLQGKTANAIFNLYANPSEKNSANKKVTMNLLEGEFTLKTSDINDFGKIKLTAAKQTVKTGFSGDFGVVDARGTQEGWNVTVSATPFTVETFEGFIGTPHQLPLGSLALNNPLNIERINHINTTDGLPTTGLNGYNILDNGAVPLLNANQGEGLGEFKFNFEDALALTVDAVTAKIDTVNYPEQDTPYVSTVTWDLVSGPQL